MPLGEPHALASFLGVIEWERRADALAGVNAKALADYQDFLASGRTPIPMSRC